MSESDRIECNESCLEAAQSPVQEEAYLNDDKELCDTNSNQENNQVKEELALNESIVMTKHENVQDNDLNAMNDSNATLK